MTFDKMTRRAVSRMCEGKDVETILRIHQKARDHREARAAMMFLTALMYPLPLGQVKRP